MLDMVLADDVTDDPQRPCDRPRDQASHAIRSSGFHRIGENGVDPRGGGYNGVNQKRLGLMRGRLFASLSSRPIGQGDLVVRNRQTSRHGMYRQRQTIPASRAEMMAAPRSAPADV
jgi:hypothetical protein